MKRRALIKKLSLIPLIGLVKHSFLSKAVAGELSNQTAETDRFIGLNHVENRQTPPNGIYKGLNVRPVINGRGTVTIIGGCRLLPEVEQAMREATLSYVALDELMDGVGKRLGKLTGTEYGMVTTGATGALIMATTGIVTGGDPDRLWQLPNLKGMKNEVIIPKYSWTAYESAVRGVGVKMVTIDSLKELKRALSPRTAMVLVLAGKNSMEGSLSIEKISSVTKPLGIPILVDAAAEGLPVPNPHISQGADLVAYSGGKYLNGPQCAGLLIGREDLIRAAWVTSSPHHGFGRGYKVGREEILGMLAAVEMWMKRDHVKENKIWTKRLSNIANRLNKIEAVKTVIHQSAPNQLSNPSPSLHVSWDIKKIPLDGNEVESLLWNANPRVAVSGAGSFLPFPPNTNPNISINSSQLKDGEEKIIADRVFEVLSHPPKLSKKITIRPYFDISGEWDIILKFAATLSNQTFVFTQKNNDLQGTHYGSYASRKLTGTIEGDKVVIRSSYTENGVRLNFTFTGNVEDNERMRGDICLSEYGPATWEAKRRQY